MEEGGGGREEGRRVPSINLVVIVVGKWCIKCAILSKRVRPLF